MITLLSLAYAEYSYIIGFRPVVQDSRAQAKIEMRSLLLGRIARWKPAHDEPKVEVYLSRDGEAAT